jgi:hypothetical protein
MWKKKYLGSWWSAWDFCIECSDFHCSQHSQQVATSVIRKNDALHIIKSSSHANLRIGGLGGGLSPRSQGFNPCCKACKHLFFLLEQLCSSCVLFERISLYAQQPQITFKVFLVRLTNLCLLWARCVFIMRFGPLLCVLHHDLYGSIGRVHCNRYIRRHTCVAWGV